MSQTEKNVNPIEESQHIPEAVEADIIPLGDDELEAVAGGAPDSSRAETRNLMSSKSSAAADDRRTAIPEDVEGLCSCGPGHKWAKYWEVLMNNHSLRRYRDVKCYSCGRQWLWIDGKNPNRGG